MQQAKPSKVLQRSHHPLVMESRDEWVRWSITYELQRSHHPLVMEST